MNNSMYIRRLAVALLAGTIGPCVAWAQTRPPAPPPPLSYQTFKWLQAHPELLKQLLTPKRLSVTPQNLPQGPSPWAPLTTQPLPSNPNAPFNAGAMLLLTDGTVMVQDQGPSNNGSGNWWRLTPDINGSYLNGTWSQLASLPAGYTPLYYASAVLPDGRVIIEGGEYNEGILVWTNQGAIYDPVANTWTAVAPPSGTQWSRIGDAPSTVLATGTFMVGASGFSGTTAQALLNAQTLTWYPTGGGKADGNGEEGWTLLPNGEVLTIDTGSPSATNSAEIYNRTAGTWTTAGDTIVALVNGGEIGPQVLRPDGTVFAAGATGHNAVYNSLAGTWKAGPDFPVINGLQYDVADGPASLLPSGNVLVAASPGIYQTPTHFFVFDGAKLNQVADTLNAAILSSFDGFMMVLPTGQVMFNSRVGDVELYTDTGSIFPGTVPVIKNVPTSLVAGNSYSLYGVLLNGRSQGAAYGDDYQSATNYPLVRLVIASTGHVFYARTSGFSGMPVAYLKLSVANFKVPAGIETGAATLYAVANGIASAPVSVTISAPASVAAAK